MTEKLKVPLKDTKWWTDMNLVFIKRPIFPSLDFWVFERSFMRGNIKKLHSTVWNRCHERIFIGGGARSGSNNDGEGGSNFSNFSENNENVQKRWLSRYKFDW